MPQTRIYTTAKDWDAMFLRAKSMHQRTRWDGQTGRREDPRGLGRSHCGGRSSSRSAAANRHRTQCRDLPVGLGLPGVVRSRFNIYGQAQSDVVPVRESLRGDRTGGGRLAVLDPVKNTVSWLQVEPRDKEPWLLPDKGLLPRRRKKSKAMPGKTRNGWPARTIL